MPFDTRIAPDAPGATADRAAMLALVARRRAIEARADAASAVRLQRFRDRGQLTLRERLARLPDPGMSFLRLHTPAGWLVEDPDLDPDTAVPGASVILGIGHAARARDDLGR